MFTIFWDASGVLYKEFLTKELTVNSDREVLCNIMITQPTHLQNLTEKKRLSFASRQCKTMLQYTNTERDEKTEIRSGSTTFLQPDLATLDFWLLPKLNERLKGQRVSTGAEVQAAVSKWIRTQPESFLMDGMDRMIEQISSC
ncbi:hypothetical protein TNCV_1237081 [Trichonephila clavipes]|nr:hypothetical protein TNCV_1237081 [Trichonephila clavipes]